MTVAERIPELISVALTAPEKTSYAFGDTLDLTGAKLTLTFDDESAEEIAVTADMVSGYDAEQAGEQTITVTYGEFSDTFTVTLTIPSGTDPHADDFY